MHQFEWVWPREDQLRALGFDGKYAVICKCCGCGKIYDKRAKRRQHAMNEEQTGLPCTPGMYEPCPTTLDEVRKGMFHPGRPVDAETLSKCQMPESLSHA